MEICPECEKESNDIFNYAYFHPFKTEPSELGKHCQECHEGSDVSFCEDCGREIYNSNGYRTNVRYVEEDECMVCVACLQKEWFEKGMDKFGEGDWFNDADLRDNGYTKERSYFCRAKMDYDICEGNFNLLQEQYGKVIVSIERSGMGFEHYIVLWYKE